MTVVVDASLVTAALVDGGPDGQWAESVLLSDDLSAPHLLLAEVDAILRRASLGGQITADVATLAHGDLLALRIELFPYGAFADRAWELRSNVTPHDAWYVALAEALEAPLGTLDRKLSRAAGPLCRFLVPAK